LLDCFNMSIAFHVATQAIRLSRSGLPMTESCLITTAIHTFAISRHHESRRTDHNTDASARLFA
jgi:hypothetical protein